MKRWIKRKTDTSIKPDNKDMFYSKGTKIEFIEEKTIINCETNDIFAGEGNLILIGTSHHTKECMEWIYWKNAVNLKNYTRYIKEKNRISLQKTKAFTLIINTRWAATNFYHWIHECLPRLSCYTKNKELANNTMYVWAGKYPPKKYHKETLEILGIKIDQLVNYQGIIECENLVNI